MAGQYKDDERGLFYNWHRFYIPELGRYNRVDPLGLYDGTNPYIYVGADPLTYFDPNGQARMVRNPRRGGGRSSRGLRWETPRENKRWIMQQNIARQREIARQKRIEAERNGMCHGSQNYPTFPTNSGQVQHIFRNSRGHVNPSTQGSRDRYANLFRRVAGNQSNRNDVGASVRPMASANGVRGYTQNYNNGQVWVHVRENSISNAGVNRNCGCSD